MSQLLDLARENATLRRALGRSRRETETLQRVVADIRQTLADRTCPAGFAPHDGHCVLGQVDEMLAQLLEPEDTGRK